MVGKCLLAVLVPFNLPFAFVSSLVEPHDEAADAGEQRSVCWCHSVNAFQNAMTSAVM